MDAIGKAIEFVNKEKIKFLRLQFVDINGIPKSISVPLGSDEELEDLFNDGVLFDGSAVDGFVEVEDSDLVMKPDPNTFSLLPWRPEESGVCRFICDIYTTENKPFVGDPRGLLKNSLKKLSEKGFSYNIGPEPEFFIIDQDEEGNYIPHDEASYFDVEPLDKGPNFRRKIVFDLEELGFEVEASHHEVAPGQNEIAFEFDDALKTADAVITFKQAIKAIVDNMGYMVTFMPKPFFGVNGSGMHCNQSLFKDGQNFFYDENGEYGLSKEAFYFMGGLLDHSPALSAIVAPTVNSYKRLIPGYEAPVYMAYGLKNRSALIRIPAARGKGTRIEYRSPDPSCNPYLAFAAMLEAGLDGIKNKIEPGDPVQFNIYDLTIEELNEKGIGILPTSLWEAYHAFERDKVIQKGLGSHISEKFLNSKYEEWDEYRIQVFGYEQKKYMGL
jgi:glutamine synthetase